MKEIGKDQLDPLDIIFTYDDSLISKSIRYVTKEEYSHCLMVYDKELILESGWMGVVISGLKRYMNSSTIRTVVRLPLSSKEAESLRNKLIPYIGDNYDYKLFFGHLFRTLFGFLKLDLGAYDSKSRWLCYEVIAKALNEMGYEFKTPIRELTPQKLLNALKEIEGVKVWKLQKE